MKDSVSSLVEHMLNEFSYPNQDNSPCQGIENVSIIVNKKRWKKRKKHKAFEPAQQPPIAFRLSRPIKPNKQSYLKRHSSMPELRKSTRRVSLRNKSGHVNDTKQTKINQSAFQSKFIANVFSEHRNDNWFLNPFNYPSQTKWKIYRCQLGAVEDSCCCNCTSDAMFEVMKGLYDCYKAKNCDGCDCVLCGYKAVEERKLAELRKSMTSAAREKILDGKTRDEKEFILKEMAKTRKLLPSGKTASDKALVDKTRRELGLPPTPKTLSEKSKMRKAEAAGIITPLEGKTPEQKEKILRAQAEMGLTLPEGRTDSEKALIEKVKASKKRSLKTALLTPLTGKTPEEKEKILRGRAMKGLPLPEAQSASEKKLIDKVRADLGLPKDPTTKSMKEKHEQAAKAGLLQPLEGKTPAEKEKTLKGLRDLGIPLPEGRTPSEKALIAKVKASPRSIVAPSEQMRRAKAEGLLTPLTGKTPEQKEKILKGLAMKGLPLPEAASPSEKKLIDKVRLDLGLPKEPTTKSMKSKYEQAAKAGLLQPLEGKTPEEKEKTLKGLHDLGIPLPEGRTPSEKALIAKVKSIPPALSIKTAGVMTPLTGKPPEIKEKVLRARAKKGIPLPEGTTPSEKKIIDKVRADLGLPKEPDTKSMKAKHEQAAKAGLLEPLEGKTPAQKEAQLKGLRDMGIPLPEGRTASEKALIAKVKAAPRSLVAPSEQLRRAKAEGLITPLTGKTPAQKEKILKGLAMKGIPLPEGTSPSEKQLITKVRDDLGLPKEPDTKSMKDKYEQAAKAGLLQPLVGKTPEEKEKILQGQHDFGIPLPEGRTPSEKALISKIKALPAGSIKTAGVMTPLTGKTQAGKEKILRARAKKGIPLPEGTTPSEKKIIDKVRADLGLPKEPDTKSMKAKHEQAAKVGLLEPLEGKTPAQKEAQLKGLRDMGIPLPEGRTPSEKALVARIKAAPRSLVAPSEQMRRAKAEGLITPLTGKTPAQKEKILKGLAMKGIPLPEGTSPSEKQLINKVRDDLGLPKEPDTKSMKSKYEKAAKAGLLQPLVGKTPEEKERILQGQHDLGIPLPEGRTPSEKALIAKVKASPPAGSIKTAGLMTPLAGKAPALKERVLRARAKKGILLPEGTTPSEKKLIDKVRADLGLPKEPDTKSMKAKHEQAAKAGLLEPLEGKTPAQKEAQLKGLRDMGIPLPEGRTPSEKALVAKVKGAPRSMVAPSEQMRRAKAEGLMTPLTGKSPAQKEKILKGLAMKGLPLPEGTSPSEKKLIDKVRDDLGLPKEPDTKSMRSKYEQAAKAGFLQPLVGKTPEEKERILQGQHDLGIPLPEGRTPSEKALIAKVKASPPAGSIKTAGLMTPLAGKAPALKEKVLRARARKGIPLPEGTTPSEKKIIDKVRADLGLPKEPDTKSMKAKHEQAAKFGLLEPLEGKTPAQKEAQLKGLRDMGIPLPEGRTPSEKALIAKVKAAPRSLASPSEQLRRAKAEGLMTPLAGKTPAQKEKILKGLAMKGLPLPEGKSPSEKKIIDKVRDDLGLPKEPDTKSMRDKHEQAAKAGLLQPLVGKTPEEKEKILQGQYDLGIPLPEGRTPSEKAIISKIKALPAGSIKTAGVMTPLAGKTQAGKEKLLRARAKKGIPLPEGTTPSEKKLIDKVRADLGLPKEPDTKSMKAKHEQAAKAGLLEPLEGKTPAQKEAQLKGLRDMGIPLPEGRTPSEQALIDKVKAAPRSLASPSEQMRRAKAEGLMTPLAGKTPAQKEKILKGLAMKGLPLPEGKSPSEKKIIDKVRDDFGLPKEPDTKSMRDKHEQAAKAGFLQPLVGKTPEEKEKILQGQYDLGIPLPEGRTPSEKALISKIKALPAGSIKTAGIMTPLAGKTPAGKEKLLRARAKKGKPLPEGTTPSEKKLIDKVRADLGLPKEPDTKSMKVKHEQAAKAGLLEPLEGKTPAQKEAQLKGLRDMGIPLPEGRTPSEKALIAKVKGAPRSMVAPSEQLRRAKAEGLMTPLTGKTPAQKEKILKGLAMKGLPLPEGTSPSEKKLIDKVRDDLGLPKEPDTKSMKSKYEQAAKAGFLQPLVGKTPEEKERILQGQHDLGIPLPEGRTPSEKALIAKVKASPPAGSIKTAGLMTPLAGKAPALKEKVLRARAKKGIPLPEGTTPSEKKIIDKVRADLGLPKEPDTKSMKAKHEQAAKAGLLEPLEGKTPAQKEAQLKGLRDMGIPLPEGRTPSEKALIAKIKAAPRSMVSPSEQLRRAKAEGLMTPLAGKTPAQKEKILKGLALKGLPLPEGKSPSEKKIIDKVRDDLGLPKEPDTKSMRDKHEQAAKAGLLQPLVGKTPEEKEKILQGQYDLGIPLPEGRTPSEKALISKIKALPAGSIKTAGVMTPLAGKTQAGKEKVLRARAKKGIPLPEGTTPSEKNLIDKVRADLGLPKEPDTKSMKAKHEQAAKAGLLEPLEGKTPAQKEAQLKGLRDMGIPLPEGRTPSEKALVAKVKGAPRSMVAPSEQLRRAKAEGLMTPLTGKTPAQKEKILKGLAMKGLPLPEGKSPSEKKIIDKVRDDLGLPKEPDTKSMRDKHEQAAKAGLLQPLVGKTPEEKEKILQGQYDLGIPLPEGRTPSEKALISKIKALPAGSIKTAGVMTPLAGKTQAGKEKVLRARAKKGIPLPEGTTPSEKNLIDKVRADLGLPKEPDTKSMKAKHEQAAKAGLLEPLEGKTPAQKEAQLKGLRDMGIPLPEGRTPSEKALVAKVKGAPRSMVAPSEQLRRAKAEGLMTPLTGKTPAQKEKILKGLAMKGLPLPEGTSPSEKKLIDKVRDDLGLPKEPDTKSMKSKYEQAAKAGFLQPLVGKTPEEKERILQGQHDLGIPLPEGRTSSEKALIAKVKASPPAGSIKTAGLMTPLAGKPPAFKEKVLRARAKKGMLLPEGTTPSEKKLIDKVRADLGLPKEPDTKSMKAKHEQAAKAGLLEPLEGKTPAQKEAQLKGLRDMGIPLPEGRTPSEKALVAKVMGAPKSLVAPSEQLRRAKAEGLMTPLTGKTPAQKEKILKGLAMKGLPLPEGKSPSEKKIIDKVRDDLGLPKEPDTKSMRDKHEQAAKAGLLQPLVGKTPEEKEKILQGQYDLGIPLSEGRTPSEKAIISKIKALPAGSIKTAGVMTPLAGKTQAGKEKLLRARAKKGIPLPEGTTPSEKKIIDKVRADLGLPKEPDTKSMKAKHEQAAKFGLLEPLEGKTPAQKEAQLKGLRDMGIPLPEGRTASEKALIAKVKAAPRSLASPSEQLRRAKAEGLMTPLAGKTPAQKEKILKGLAMKGLPLPEGKSPSEKKIIDKVRDDFGLPKEPDTKSMRDKHEQAAKAGLLQPLVGKTPEEKEKILQGQYDLGIPLPEGRTPSEKALISKIKALPAGSIKTAGIMTPLAGKTQAGMEKVLRARAKKGIPLPEGTTPSEKKVIDKVRADLGLPKEPDTKSMKAKHEQAAKAGLLEPLEGKTAAQKEAQLKGLRDMGIPLPEGRTPSEKALVAKIKAAPRSLVAPSEQLRRAKAEGLITPLTGKTPAQQEKILKGLAMKGIPLPEGTSPSEKQLINKVRDDLGLPKEPDTKSMKDKHEQAAKAGFLQPLVGKTPEEKERILQGQHDLGIPLPEGRTPSEKALINKIKASPPAGSIKTAGLMTPLAGKTPAHKEKVLRARAMKGIPLPEGTTPSEKKVIDKVRADLGLPKEPDTKSMKAKHEQAAKAGLLEPLEGKTAAQKEAQLKGLRDMGIPLPEGRTPSEKALIAKVKAAPRSLVSPSEQLRRAKAEGLITPLTGKTPAQQEKILKGLAMKGIPLPEGKSPSEKQLINKVRDDLGLPKEPDTKSMKDKHEQAAKAGFLQPLVGKTAEEKEKILQGQHDLGIPLPEGRTPSEKALINKIKASPPAGSIKTAGLMTPLAGKTPAHKEKVLRARAMKGIPLPEGTTPSEKKVIDKVRADLGLPKEPDTKSMKAKHEQAAKAGFLEPLEGKTAAQKEAQLKGLRDMGIPLPEGRTPSEKALVAKVMGAPKSLVAPSEQLRRAKAEGLMTPLTGKTPAQKEKILKGLAMKGLPLPEGKSPSEKKIIDKVRDDLGLPKEPDTKSMRDKHEQAAKAGLLQPLVGKTPEEKEKILQGQYDLGIPLPEGRTPSEKAIISKIKALPVGSIKTAGVMTPLAGKTQAGKEKVLRARAKKGIPLPEGTTPSEKKLIDKVRDDLGLPKEPDTKSMRDKHEQAAKAGFLQPLVGKTPEEKEKILQGQYDLGIPLPEGRTPSEKAIISKIKALPAGSIKTAGVMTPLAGKTPAGKEKLLRARAKKGIPLPEGTTPSEKKLIDKVRADLGLPKEPDTKSMKAKHEQAAKFGLLEPLEGKTPAQKEAQLKGLRDMGIPLPEGRTPSEKALVAKVMGAPKSLVAPSEQLRRAKAEGLMTPLTGKTPAQKEKILKGLAMKGLPLPEGKSPSEKELIDKVRDDLGLPKEPDTKSMRDKHEQAAKAGLLQPLVGKTPEEKEKILQGQYDLGIPLPEGRTPSEKAIISKIKALPAGSIKTAGVMMPLAGKTPAGKEKLLRARAKKGIPLPEGTTPSEKKLIDKVRADLGLPKEPDTKSMKEKHEQAAKFGLLEPLEGKTPAQKEAQLKGLRDMGIPLPEGRTPSEKALVAKVMGAPKSIVAPSEQLRRAKAEGLMTPLTGKTPAQKEKILKGLAMKGLPLPEGKSPSEKELIDKVRDDLGLPKEPDTKSMRDKHEQAAKAGLLQPLMGKTPEEKEKILQGQYDLGIPLPEGRTPSEKAIISKIKALPAGSVKTAGVMTPLAGKTPAGKEKLLRARAKKGIPLPEGTTPSEKKLIDKVRADLGLPKEPDTKSMKAKHEQAAKAGLLEPLEGKTPAQKEAQLKGLRDMGIPLPEGRTASEKALIAKVKAAPRSLVAPSEQLRRAKAEGLITPLTGKTPAQKEKILKGLAMKGIPLPEGTSPSEKQLIAKVRDDLGLPKEPDTKSMKDKYEQAAKAGLLQPLVGKTPEEKEKILQGQHDFGIPLPEGRTPSEKALIEKVKASPRAVVAHSEQLRRAKAEGLLTPLTGKTPEQKEKILKGLAMKGLSLPEPQTPSEKKLVDKVRADLGLPKEPTTKALRDKFEQAAKAGLLQPLEGKTPEEKEETLKSLQEMGIPLPEGRTPSEKALVAKVKASTKKPESVPTVTTEKIRKAKEAGLLTPLAGKTPEQKEKLLQGLAQTGLPLPEGKTRSEKALIKKVKQEFGIPDRTPSEKLRRAKATGLLTPLDGKTPAQKEKILRGRAAAGLPLPVDRTPSERALIKKIKDETGYVTPSPSERIKKAKAAGLLTPLEGKTPEEKEKIVKGLAEAGLPLPVGKTKSEKSMIAKIKARIPPEGKTPSEKSIIGKAKAAGLFTPIAGKSPAEKERILKGLADAGLPLPEGKTASEKDMVKKIRAEAGYPPEPTPSEKKGKIRKKAKKVGVSASKKAAGISAEEFEDIIKTTKCDRACGCDRKKIRFKHSYVKIRVTSPDISSLCDCPDECLPGVKAGAFIDNEGIKVTVGSAVGIPSYSMVCINQEIPNKMVSNLDLCKNQTSYNNVNVLSNSKYKFYCSGNNANDNLNVSSSDISYRSKHLYNTHSENNYVPSSIANYQGRTCKSEKITETLKDLQLLEDIYKEPTSKTKSVSSFDTILIIRNDMSLSTSTSDSMDTISLTSVMGSSLTSSSAHYSGYSSTNDLLSIDSLDGSITSDDYIDSIRERNALRNIEETIQQRYTIQITRKRFAATSSVFLMVPTSEDDEGEEGSSNSVDSMTSMQSNE